MTRNFLSLRPRTLRTLLLLVSAFAAALATRTYGQNTETYWAYWLGELALRVGGIVVGSLLIAGVLLDPTLLVELRGRGGTTREPQTSDKAKWVLIGAFLIATGILLTINGLGFFFRGCQAAGC